MMRQPHAMNAVCASILLTAILPPSLGLWPLPSSVLDAMPTPVSGVWAALATVSLAGAIVGTLARMRLRDIWWPVYTDLVSTAGVAIVTLTYAVALAYRFQALSTMWSLAPFVAVGAWQAARVVSLWRWSMHAAHEAELANDE